MLPGLRRAIWPLFEACPDKARRPRGRSPRGFASLARGVAGPGVREWRRGCAGAPGSPPRALLRRRAGRAGRTGHRPGLSRAAAPVGASGLRLGAGRRGGRDLPRRRRPHRRYPLGAPEPRRGRRRPRISLQGVPPASGQSRSQPSPPTCAPTSIPRSILLKKGPNPMFFWQGSSPAVERDRTGDRASVARAHHRGGESAHPGPTRIRRGDPRPTRPRTGPRPRRPPRPIPPATDRTAAASQHERSPDTPAAAGLRRSGGARPAPAPPSGTVRRAAARRLAAIVAAHRRARWWCSPRRPTRPVGAPRRSAG